MDPHKNDELVAIDVKLTDQFESSGTAFFRLDEHMREFLKKCQEKTPIIGFSWDGGWNFGVVLGPSRNPDENLPTSVPNATADPDAVASPTPDQTEPDADSKREEEGS